jgi:hypothetical protein
MHNMPSANVRTSKMPLRTFFVFAIILLIAIGVTWRLTRNYYDNTKATDSAFLRLDSSLIGCNKFFQSKNLSNINEIEEKLQDPITREKAIQWYAKAKMAIKYTQSAQQFIQSSKSSIIASSQYADTKDESSSFYDKKLYSEIFDTINSFSNHLIGLIPNDKISYLGVLPIQTIISKPTDTKLVWAKTYFEGLSNKAIGAVLSKVENDVLRSTDIILNFMNNQSESIIYYDEFLLPLVSQNSMVFLPGQTLEISAGLGAYSSISTPKIKINNQFIHITENGYGIYKKIITNEKSGSLPIIISYKDPNTGKLSTLSKSINYTVFQPPKK